MKRSRVFLGVTTALLAIASVAAAKAHRHTAAKLWYYTGKVPSQHLCLQAPFETHCAYVNGGTIKCYYLTNPSTTTALTLYTKFSSTNVCGAIAKYRLD